MESKLFKTALILAFSSFLLVSIVFGAVLLVVRGPSLFRDGSKLPACTQAQAAKLGNDLILNSATFIFDGIQGSVSPVKAQATGNGQSWNLAYTFQTGHPGHGDRTGQVLAQVITTHPAVVIVTDCKVVSAVCDGMWNLVTDRPLPLE